LSLVQSLVILAHFYELVIKKSTTHNFLSKMTFVMSIKNLKWITSHKYSARKLTSVQL
jgi:hypothetical protein